MKQTIPNNIREQLSMRIKNKVDISDLIEPYSIKCEDFSGAIITKLTRLGEDISNLNLTNAIVGTDSGETNISRAIATNCCFKNTKFLGKVLARKTDLTGTNFSGAFIPVCDYRFAILRGCTFCGTAFTIATHYSAGAKFDDKFFMDLSQMWDIVIIPREKYEYLLANQK